MYAISALLLLAVWILIMIFAFSIHWALGLVVLILPKVAQLATTHEHYQKMLGQMAYEIAERYGRGSLDDFAGQVKETHGISLSPATLKNYEYVYRNIKDLELPEDLSYRTLQYIASSGKPDYWAKRINDEGLSSAEVYRLIRLDKGIEKKKRIVVCPHCNNQLELSI